MKIRAFPPILMGLVLVVHAAADGPRTITIRTTSPETAMRASMERGAYAEALEHIDRALRARPDDPLLLYNRACAKAQLDKPDHAAATLMDALRHGFNAFSHMQRDPDLEAIRGHPTFRAIVDARRAADDILAERRLNEWREKITDGAVEAVDERRRLHYRAVASEAELDAIRDDVNAHLDLLNEMLFDDPPGLWCLIVIPQQDVGRSLLGRAHVKGHYRHNTGVLIALDRDISLRHELVHLLHHRHMDAVGQQHPIWIQEGLAVLFEQYRIRSDGSVRFQAGDRLNHAKRLARDNRLLSWSSLLTMDTQTFHREAHRVYAQVDSIFRFIAEHGMLSQWYERYVDDFDTDPTGGLALEFMFDQPLAMVESRWLEWLDEQPFRIDVDEVAINLRSSRAESDRRGDEDDAVDIKMSR